LVWIVDDVPLELEASRSALGDAYDIQLFSDGSQVLERAATGDLPDLLVLDWHMQGVGGLDVLRYLRSENATIGLPVLVFTATGDRDDLLDALASGADDYVGKGATNEEFRARVLSLLRAKSLRDRAERAEAELAVQLERERIARAEAEAANRAKDLFLATLSHELRNPLSAIVGWSRMLKNEALGPEQIAKAIDTIERNAVAQARMIEDLFDVARIVSGNLRLDLASIDLAREVEAAVETMRPNAANAQIELRAELVSSWVSGDGSRLQQVALNLIGNAVKFTPAGGNVVVRLVERDGTALLSVTDTGRGIDADLLPHVFDRFRQGDPSITRKHGGLGLGLAIVRELVELHGGSVRARNEAGGGGATFEILLPICAPAAPSPPDRSADAIEKADRSERG
jgi:signal transduction histidine kinase